MRSAFRRHGAAISALAPSALTVLVFVYGFAAWTGYISLSASRMVPDFAFTGFDNYARMWQADRWQVSALNLAVFTTLYVSISVAVGLALAILLDRDIRGEGMLRTIFLYPVAVSLVVTGVVWKWLLNPGTGIEAFVRDLGFAGFAFDWIIDRDRVIYAVVAAAVWQQAGFVAVLFSAALRGIETDMIRAAEIDGAGPFRIYRSVILPTLGPAFISALVILIAFALKTFDLVVVMTAQGPGYASALPSTFVYDMTFQRNQMGVGAAAATSILAFSLLFVVPYAILELGKKR
jgi:glucose/mannose transport system permease protein